ncbi:hypothetical protein D3C73_1152830 [compost metagenome]
MTDIACSISSSGARLANDRMRPSAMGCRRPSSGMDRMSFTCRYPASSPSSSTIGNREKPVRLTAFSKSTGVEAVFSTTSLSKGTMMCEAVCSENSKAPLSRPVSSSTKPWRVDS